MMDRRRRGPALYLGNEDQLRMAACYGNDKPEYYVLSARMLSAFLLTMRALLVCRR
ncbi:hypothetical protein OCV73_02165 [Barnesiella propionica]|uniref:hypothetical protein n=1 Tax=Barnesiella propionica TaxID=2981781 RepID=UPI0014307A4D|nr:hypothetical protein [Barnesiella propionica]MCU6767764.1 hypothetical protein [Barnesiella propionica]